MSEQTTIKPCPHTAMGIKKRGFAGYLRDQAEAWSGVGDADQASHFAALLEAVEELVPADAGAGALALLSRLIDVSHEVAAEDIPYKVTSPEQAILAGLRDGYAHGRNRALSVMQGTICGMMQALRDRYGIAETAAKEATDETA